MTVTITETITRNLRVELTADHIHALVAEAALREVGLSMTDKVSVSFYASPASVSIAQQIEGIGVKPMEIKAEAPKEAVKEIGQKPPGAIKANGWTEAEDDEIVRITGLNPGLSRHRISMIVAEALTGRTATAIEFRMKNKLNERVEAVRLPASAPEAPQSAAASGSTLASEKAPEATPAPAPRQIEASFANLPADLCAHLKGLPKVEGWSLSDDSDLMGRIVAGENMSLIAAAVERETGFIVRRVDQLLGRQKGGAVRFGRAVVAKALADTVGVSTQGGAA